MSRRSRFEAERSAWIKSIRWPNPAAASRRSDRLARRARQIERTDAGLGEGPLHEGETGGTLHRWTHHDDSATSALGAAAFVIIFVLVVPLLFGLAWLVGALAYRGWERMSHVQRVRVWPYPVLALLAAVVLAFAHGAGWDIWAIPALADVVEAVSGGLVAPYVLSQWYATGWMRWLEIQVVLGFLFAGWQAFAWGWAAPAVRQAAAARVSRPHDRPTSATDKAIKIISSAPVTGRQQEGEDT